MWGRFDDARVSAYFESGDDIPVPKSANYSFLTWWERNVVDRLQDGLALAVSAVADCMVKQGSQSDVRAQTGAYSRHCARLCAVKSLLVAREYSTLVDEYVPFPTMTGCSVRSRKGRSTIRNR